MPLGSPFVLHQPVYRFRSETKDKTSIIYQVGYGLFSVHGIPPYRSWDKFLPFVTSGIDALLKSRPEDDARQTFSQEVAGAMERLARRCASHFVVSAT